GAEQARRHQIPGRADLQPARRQLLAADGAVRPGPLPHRAVAARHHAVGTARVPRARDRGGRRRRGHRVHLPHQDLTRCDVSHDPVPDDMVPIPGGTFRMGSEEFYPDERPVHERTVAGFLLDRHAVTNEDFAAFVEATGYVTVAERPMDAADYPGVAAEDLVPGALVFTPTPGPVDLADWRQWWRWQPGAQWRHPEGPESTIDGRMRHPVVQVAFEDAAAYARWSGKRLPTEAEHEYAARGGGDGARFAWGDEPYPGDIPQANTWIGRFPYDNRGRFGAGTAPVGSYPA